MLPVWPATPDIPLVEPCPSGLACITTGDQLAIIYHEDALLRIKNILDHCPNVEFRGLLTETQDPTPQE